MAAGVADEINNPSGESSFMATWCWRISGKRYHPENMKKIIDETNRCKNIVQGLLDFARTPTVVMLHLQINELVTAALNLVKDQSIFDGIEVETHFAENLPEVNGDLSRLEEVFLDLFINAADAMREKGGRLRITTSSYVDRVKVLITETGKGSTRRTFPISLSPSLRRKAGPGHRSGALHRVRGDQEA